MPERIHMNQNGGVPPDTQANWPPLFDSYGRRHDYLRLSLTDRCNFRCQYCMPMDGVEWKPRSEILSIEEIERLVGIFVRLGVTKVRLTGGEPTVRRGFVELLQSLHQAHPLTKLLLTTNGASLRQTAGSLKEAGLSGINVSLDSLRRDRFHEITRRDALMEVLEGIDAVIAEGVPTKINVVVLPGINDDELVDFVEYVRDRPVQVRFIEFMPFAGNLWTPDRVVSFAEMKSTIAQSYRLEHLSTPASAVAREFRISGFAGTIGFITSVTEDFCDGCNRIRLTADGRVKACLFLPSQTSLRDMMRAGVDDAEIAQAIRANLRTKWQGHPDMNDWRQLDQLSMVQIGG